MHEMSRIYVKLNLDLKINSCNFDFGRIPINFREILEFPAKFWRFPHISYQITEDRFI